MSLKLKIGIVVLCLLFLTPLAVLGYLYWTVTREAETLIQRGAIDSIIASESPVFYDDGVTPIGVFFEKTHSKYIRYQEIPRVFVDALVAAEDKDFFQHGGFDLSAIARAALANLRAKDAVQGGSTLTQQTAKNVFRRERKSYMAKLRELMQAFLLERKYSKEEIFEMYANQFFVTGYGKGLRIAAQYFFDKPAEDLELVEAAFIAGCVKAPNRYNPFIKKTAAEKENAGKAANDRKDYVLKRMRGLGTITPEQFAEASRQEVPFKEGTITYRLNVILNYVREQLESEYFKGVLQSQGIENIASSGIGIHTSINWEMQQAALRSLRSHLPRLDVELSGYPAGRGHALDELLERSPMTSDQNMPFLARITEIHAAPEACSLRVAWNDGEGIIPYEGLKDMGQAWLKSRSAKPKAFDRATAARFLLGFRVGDTVPVLAPAADGPTQGPNKLVLGHVPELEGGIVVLQHGAIKAMVGGYSNRFFNRAVEAKRQLGSLFKPLVYAAALQLKWSVLDPLDNTPDVYTFEKTEYVPRPDHPPQSREVSMALAGAKSENLASVWLLYHLTDRLNMNEFRQIAELVGLSRKPEETLPAYKARIRDVNGIVVDRQALLEAAFEESKRQAESDIIFAGHHTMLAGLRRLHYSLEPLPPGPEGVDRRKAAPFDFRELMDEKANMESRLAKARSLLRQWGPVKAMEKREEMEAVLGRFYRTSGDERGVRICYSEFGDFVTTSTALPLTPEEFITGAVPMEAENVWIEGQFVAHVLDLLRETTAREYDKLALLPPYEPEVLFRVRDFRTLVGLKYVSLLCERLGISTELEPVLSFPLGPNAISIVEAALAYQALMTGKVSLLGGRPSALLPPVITRLEDRHGELLWEYKPEPRQVLSEKVCASISEVLRMVMDMGTGQKAKGAVTVMGVPIPAFGKTGTANRFTNSSFIGSLPGPNPQTGELDVREAYTIAAYVGYDDNRPMKTDHQVVYGASGALPLWSDTANAIVNSKAYAKQLQLADLAFDAMEVLFLPARNEFSLVPLSPVTGLPEGSPGTRIQGALPRIAADAVFQDGKWQANHTFNPLKGKLE